MSCFFIQEVVSFFGIVIIIPEGVGYFDVYLHVLLLLSVLCFFQYFYNCRSRVNVCWPIKLKKPPPLPTPWLWLLSVLRRWFCCSLLLLYPCLVIYYFASSLDMQSKLVASLLLSSWCYVSVSIYFFLTAMWVCLQCVIVTCISYLFYLLHCCMLTW